MNFRKASALALLTFLAAAALQAGPSLEIKLRVYEGSRDAVLTPPPFVTSSYIRPTTTANVQTGFDLNKEAAQIKKVFNLKDVTLLTEGLMTLDVEKAGQSSEAAQHFFRLNGNSFQVSIRLTEAKSKLGFSVVFDEIVDEKTQNILTTEMLLVSGHSAVLGFEDRSGKPYFCSFHVSGPAEGIPVPPPPSSPPAPPAPPKPPDIGKKIEQFEKGAVKAAKTVKPPRLLKSATPVFPQEAKEKGLEGVVVVNARMDTRGNVTDVMILKSSNEIFNAPSIEAVKAWKYEPMVIKGKPQNVVFTVTIRYALKTEKPKPPDKPKPPNAPGPPPPPPAPVD